jgi:hypothetical protein
VRMPRIRIAMLMAVVAIPALDFGVILVRTYDNPSGWGDDILVAGALPMANILAVGLLISLQRRSRGFLWGFEAFGAAALAFFALDFLCGLPMTSLYWDLIDSTVKNIFNQNHGFISILYYPDLWPLILGLPQLVCALFGGFLFRKFR